MRVVEQQVVGKHPDLARCEDTIVVTSTRVAVIDGATDKSGTTISTVEGEVTSGRFAATVLATALQSLPEDASPRGQVEYLTEALNTAIESKCGPLEAHERPSASIVVLDTKARLIWRVGDCPFCVDGQTWNTPKRIDSVTSDFRAAYLAAAGADSNPPAGTDPGREAILPLLRIQGNLANTPGEFGYGVLNGTGVPTEFIEVVHLPDTAREVVLASDGYPSISGSLEQAEAELAHLLAVDPTCTGPLRSTKGLTAGMRSFDDRSWVRILLNP